MSDIFHSLLDSKEAENRADSVGRFGEETAAAYLERRGFRLVASNFKTPVGRNRKGVQVTGEIDLIALDVDMLCFVEVKTRSSEEYASPLSAVDVRKQRQITRTARAYRKTFDLQGLKFRYDVISVVLQGTKAPKVEYFKGFWNENKFKKKVWIDEFEQ